MLDSREGALHCRIWIRSETDPIIKALWSHGSRPRWITPTVGAILQLLMTGMFARGLLTPQLYLHIDNSLTVGY